MLPETHSDAVPRRIARTVPIPKPAPPSLKPLSGVLRGANQRRLKRWPDPGSVALAKSTRNHARPVVPDGRDRCGGPHRDRRGRSQSSNDSFGRLAHSRRRLQGDASPHRWPLEIERNERWRVTKPQHSASPRQGPDGRCSRPDPPVADRRLRWRSWSPQNQDARGGERRLGERAGTAFPSDSSRIDSEG